MLNFNNMDKYTESRLPNKDMSGLLIRDLKWSVKTAGPSPFNNERTELFLLGCKKAMSGNPCKGCFNSSTWNKDLAKWSHDPKIVAKNINQFALNKYITIGGGEPTDQLNNLIILCKELKKYNFNIMIYTWQQLKDIVKDSTYKDLLDNIDILVDGQYKEEERLWNGEKEDGLLSSVGSGNQIIWNIQEKIGYYMRDLKEIHLINNKLTYITKKNKIDNYLKF